MDAQVTFYDLKNITKFLFSYGKHLEIVKQPALLALLADKTG
jgi:hypothetical protein